MRKICVAVGSRANYSSIKSVMQAVKEHPKLELQVVAFASAVLDRFGEVANQVEKDGFEIQARVPSLLEGSTPAIMAESTGISLMKLPTVFDMLQPDIVVTVGDRFETMATSLAAVYMNIPLAHTMGGEVTGTIDESIRHAITKLAHIHFPASEDARERIIKMGEEPEFVYKVGCPRIDHVKEILDNHRNGVGPDLFKQGVGGEFDLSEEFLLVSQHPVTTEYGSGEDQVMATLQAIYELDVPTVALWPNADAGGDDISRGMRKFREHYDASKVHFFKNLPIEVYNVLMERTACIIGNSSSAIREGAFIGTPAVNIGSRQNARERGQNVIDVGYEKDEIKAAIEKQMAHGHYESDPIYGDGKAGERIAEILVTTDPPIQKKIDY